MLHIILLILKIIGIILLCILGVLLLAVCCVLLVPLRYRIEVFREEGEGKPLVNVRIKITWLLHFINVLLCYPADVYVRARICLFTVFRMPKKEKKRKRAGRQKKTEEGTDSEGTDSSDKTEGSHNSGEDESAGNGETAQATEQGEQTEQTERQTGMERQETSEDTEAGSDDESGSSQSPSGFAGRWLGKIRRLIGRLKEIIRKIAAAVENIRYTIRHFCDKIKAMLDNIQYYREVMESEAFRRSWLLCKKQAVALLKELKPDKVEAELVIGTGDPAATGEILALCGMLYPLMGQKVRVLGDFERPHIEGYVYMKGKIRALPFLYAAVKVYRNKDIRILIKLFKKEAV